MNNGSNHDEFGARKLRVVEIVGPAGAGKTTLYQALGCHLESVRLGNFPNVHRVADTPFFILNGLRLLPDLLGVYRPGSRQMTRREFAWMSILYGWSALLHKQSQAADIAMILDQGPIYLLAEMRLFGPEYLRQSSADSLWQALYARWKTILDMVIWLDAADDVLLERIRNREQDLVVKNQPATVVYEYLNRYRTEYAFLLSTLAAKNRGLRIVRFDGGLLQPEEILNRSLSALRY